MGKYRQYLIDEYADDYGWVHDILGLYVEDESEKAKPSPDEQNSNKTDKEPPKKE